MPKGAFVVDSLTAPTTVTLCNEVCSMLGAAGTVRFSFLKSTCAYKPGSDDSGVVCRLGRTGGAYGSLGEDTVDVQAVQVDAGAAGEVDQATGRSFEKFVCKVPAVPPSLVPPVGGGGGASDAVSPKLRRRQRGLTDGGNGTFGSVISLNAEVASQGGAAAWGPVNFDVSLAVLVNGAVVRGKGNNGESVFTFSYRSCCVPLAGPVLWPLWVLLPLSLLLCACPMCLVIIRTSGPMQTPHLQYADAVMRPTTPKVITTTKTFEETIRKPRPKPPPKKKPPVKTGKKKWDTVATGQYLRNGAFVETNWGKLGEMGGETMIDEDEESSSDDGGGNGGGNEEEKVVLHETITVDVTFPAAIDVQLAQLDEALKTPRGVQTVSIDVVGPVGGCCKACCTHWKTWVTCFVSCCLFGAVVALLVILIAAADKEAKAYALTCATQNVTALCSSIMACGRCDAEQVLCTWCGTACLVRNVTTLYTQQGGEDSGSGACAADRVCPPESVSVNDLSGWIFFAMLFLLVLVVIVWCLRRGAGAAAEGGAAGGGSAKRGGGGGGWGRLMGGGGSPKKKKQKPKKDLELSAANIMASPERLGSSGDRMGCVLRPSHGCTFLPQRYHG